jgi:hypothetical protein
MSDVEKRHGRQKVKENTNVLIVLSTTQGYEETYLGTEVHLQNKWNWKNCKT